MQDEIDRLQERRRTIDDRTLAALWARKKELLERLEAVERSVERQRQESDTCPLKKSTTRFASSSRIGKEKGYLLYDEVNELLPADITSSEELDDLFSTFGSAGIEVVDSEKTYRDDKLQGEGGEESDLDLTPGALDKTNDPVRMYLREMGTVPLLTREGEVAIAKRIEQGKLAVIKSISRTPKVTQEVIEMGEQLKRGERTVRELVVFNEEEITDEKIAARQREFLKQIDTRAARARSRRRSSRRSTATSPKTDKRKYRRAQVEDRPRAQSSSRARSARSSSPRWSSAG